MDTELFVQNVKKYCKAKGVKATVACTESGAGKNLMSEITKRGSTPSVGRIQLLAQYLGCTVSDLLGEQAGTQSSPPSEDDELLRKITALEPESRQRAEEYLDFLLSRQDKP